MIRTVFWIAAIIFVIVAVTNRDGDGEEPSRAAATGSFAPSSVRAKVRTKQHLGGQVQAFFVATGAKSTHVQQAQDCVAHYLDDEDTAAVFCFAFPSLRAYTYARVDTISGGMKKLCWTARASVALSGDTDAAGDDETRRLIDNCPGTQKRLARPG